MYTAMYTDFYNIALRAVYVARWHALSPDVHPPPFMPNINTMHFTEPYTVHCTLYYILHSTVHYILDCTLHCMLHHSLYKHQSD